jgi:tRNA splicing ligase
MPKAIDPLLILREHIQQNKKIERKGPYLYFSNKIKLKIDTPTACKQQHTEKQYTLGSIWLYLMNKDDNLASYMSKANKEKIETISMRDKSIISLVIRPNS